LRESEIAPVTQKAALASVATLESRNYMPFIPACLSV